MRSASASTEHFVWWIVIRRINYIHFCILSIGTNMINTRNLAKLGGICSWFCWLGFWCSPQWYVWRLSTSRSFTNTKEPLTEYICKLNKALILFNLHYWISFSILTIRHFWFKGHMEFDYYLWKFTCTMVGHWSYSVGIQGVGIMQINTIYA